MSSLEVIWYMPDRTIAHQEVTWYEKESEVLNMIVKYWTVGVKHNVEIVRIPRGYAFRSGGEVLTVRKV